MVAPIVPEGIEDPAMSMLQAGLHSPTPCRGGPTGRPTGKRMLFDASGSGSHAPGGMISHPSREASPVTTARMAVSTATWIPGRHSIDHE